MSSAPTVRDRLHNLRKYSDEDLKVDELARPSLSALRHQQIEYNSSGVKKIKNPTWWPADMVFALKVECIKGEKLQGPSKKQLMTVNVSCYRNFDAEDIGGKFDMLFVFVLILTGLHITSMIFGRL